MLQGKILRKLIKVIKRYRVTRYTYIGYIAEKWVKGLRCTAEMRWNQSWQSSVAAIFCDANDNSMEVCQSLFDKATKSYVSQYRIYLVVGCMPL